MPVSATGLVRVAEVVRRALPHAVGIGARRDAADDQLPALLPSEASGLGPRATERRRRTFALGRHAARDALVDLGLEPAPIGRGPAGEPLWPPGIVGTISHSGDLALAVVGWQTASAGLGIDLEQLSPGLSARAARLVCTPAEMAWLSGSDDSRHLTMLFSAKEAVFKATFPIAGIWLGFADAELTWQPARPGFDARLRKAVGPQHPAGTVLEVACVQSEASVLSITRAPAPALPCSAVEAE